MSAPNSFGLPRGWTIELTSRGAILRVRRGSRRFYLVGGATVLAAAMSWRVFVQWNLLSQEDTAIRFALTLILTVFALWCAFADEAWHLEKNLLVHRVGIRGWGYSARIQDAELEIVLRFSTQFSRPYWRLYAAVKGKSQFLIERDVEELRQLAHFISFHTGWQIRHEAAV